MNLTVLTNKGEEKFEELGWSAENIAHVLAEKLMCLFWSCTHLLGDMLTFFSALFVGKVVVVVGLNTNPTHFSLQSYLFE